MPRTAKDTLDEAKKVHDGVDGGIVANGASPVHPGDDTEWWITDVRGNTFAIGTWDGDNITFRNYRP